MNHLQIVALMLFVAVTGTYLAVWLMRGSKERSEAPPRLAYADGRHTEKKLDAQAVCALASRALSAHVALLARDGGKLHLIAVAPRQPVFELLDRAAADWALTHCIPTGRGTGVMTLSDWQFQPVLSKGALRGLLAVAGRGAREPVAPDQQWLLEDILRDAASALAQVEPEQVDQAPVAISFG